MQKKINLHQEVATMDKFKKMIKKNELPLVLILDEVEFSLYKEIEKSKRLAIRFKEYSYVRNLYYPTCLITDESRNQYMLLDKVELERLIDDKKLRVKRFIDEKGNNNLVTCIGSNASIETSTMIRYVDKKDKNNIKTTIIQDLQISIGKKYIKDKEQERNKVLKLK